MYLCIVLILQMRKLRLSMTHLGPWRTDCGPHTISVLLCPPLVKAPKTDTGVVAGQSWSRSSLHLFLSRDIMSFHPCVLA
jgi:hypothetical protein